MKRQARDCNLKSGAHYACLPLVVSENVKAISEVAMKIDVETLVCPNGHNRKFLVTHTSVASKVVVNEKGRLENRQLEDAFYGYVVLYHCADCGACRAFEITRENEIVED